MIARATHSVNSGLVLSPSPLTAVGGVDLAATLDRIVGWGGDSSLYSHFLIRGLAAAEPTGASIRTLGVLAGWRSGVVDLRDEALARAGDVEGDAAAAALGLAGTEFDGFLKAQAKDPFAWPTTDTLVARIGGFSGFGDVWTARPTEAHFVSRHAIEIACGAELWVARVDVFGGRLARADGPIPNSKEKPTARALLSENSYLVDIVRAVT